MHLVVRKVVALSQIRKFQGPVFPPLPYPLDHDRSRDKALLIGIGYNPAHHDVHALEHPHRDVDMFKEYLVEHEGYLPERVKVLKDDSKDPLLQPTRMNIVSFQVDYMFSCTYADHFFSSRRSTSSSRMFSGEIVSSSFVSGFTLPSS